MGGFRNPEGKSSPDADAGWPELEKYASGPVLALAQAKDLHESAINSLATLRELTLADNNAKF